MRTLIVDDEIFIRKGLISLIERLDKGLKIIGEGSSVKEAIKLNESLQPDLIFLDINLKDGNAFDFLDNINHINFHVVFVTAYDEYALQALKNGAVDYILKPVDIEELSMAIDKVIDHCQPINTLTIANTRNQFSLDKIVLSLQGSLQFILYKDLMYCKSDGGYTSFHLSDKRVFVASKPIKDFEKQLSQSSFIRTHQSYLVNTTYIDKYDKTGYLYLNNGSVIPVSNRKKDLVINRLLK
ncbi:LytTR family DNA-binding domain-containing protein [Aquimarina sp. AU58]|uniref:LytR/AlgR family response regulator transcription factor n=1 Tax=Aquimarina sp. AU58 TaxID=1874112 RepID=UPI000D6DFF20|nr:LytTR family DNA-binding domain-containing protein [Aquimarina sp. AU58]